MAGAWASGRLSDIGNSRTGRSRSPDSRGAPPRMAFALSGSPASSWPVASVAGSGSPALPGHGQNGDLAVETYRLEGHHDLVDVASSTALAQVKWKSKAVGRPDVQQLLGADAGAGRTLIFFSRAGYTQQALAYAESVGIRCFTLASTCVVTAANGAATIQYRDAHRYHRQHGGWTDPAVTAAMKEQVLKWAGGILLCISIAVWVLWDDHGPRFRCSEKAHRAWFPKGRAPAATVMDRGLHPEAVFARASRQTMVWKLSGQQTTCARQPDVGHEFARSHR